MPPVTDVHIHIASNERPDCKVSHQMRTSPSFAYMLLAHRIRPSDLDKHFDETLRENIIGSLNEAPSIDKGIILALDAIYEEDGTRKESESHLIVSNDYVRELAAANSKVLVGASVNPNRGHEDGLRELERCLQSTPPPALIKLIPNSQLIDMADPHHDWFYEKIAEAGVPLLCHTGPEHAVPVPPPENAHQKLGDPRKLQRALDIGVTVIACHCATRFFPFEPDYLDELAEMMAQADRNGQWNLYADVSAMCVLCRVGTVDRVLDKIPSHRMVLGSDHPIPVSDMPPLLISDFTPDEYLEIIQIENPIEKNYRQLLAMGFPQSLGTKAAELIPPNTV